MVVSSRPPPLSHVFEAHAHASKPAADVAKKHLVVKDHLGPVSKDRHRFLGDTGVAPLSAADKKYVDELFTRLCENPEGSVALDSADESVVSTLEACVNERVFTLQKIRRGNTAIAPHTRDIAVTPPSIRLGETLRTFLGGSDAAVQRIAPKKRLPTLCSAAKEETEEQWAGRVSKQAASCQRSRQRLPSLVVPSSPSPSTSQEDLGVDPPTDVTQTGASDDFAVRLREGSEKTLAEYLKQHKLTAEYVGWLWKRNSDADGSQRNHWRNRLVFVHSVVRHARQTFVQAPVDPTDKDDKLWEILQQLPENAHVIIFAGATSKGAATRRVEDLSQRLWQGGLGCCNIHEEKGRHECQIASDQFASGECSVLIATDDAARGLAFPGKRVTHVICFDMAHDLERYLHRLERTQGEAIVFWHPSALLDKDCAPALVKIARDAGQSVPPWLARYELERPTNKAWKLDDAVLKLEQAVTGHDQHTSTRVYVNYLSEKKNGPARMCDLTQAVSITKLSFPEFPYAFRIAPTTPDSKAHTIVLAAESSEECDKWIAKLQALSRQSLCASDLATEGSNADFKKRSEVWIGDPKFSDGFMPKGQLAPSALSAASASRVNDVRKVEGGAHCTKTKQETSRHLLRYEAKGPEEEKSVREDIKRVFKSADTDQSGLIDFEEFAAMSVNKGMPMSELRRLFGMLDVDNSGSLDLEEFSKYRYELGQEIISTYMEAYRQTSMRQAPLRCLLRDPLACELSAAYCGLTDRMAPPLAVVLPRLSGLQCLLLSDNRLADEGCTLLCKAIATRTGTLQAIDLDNNRLRRAGAEALGSLIGAGKVEEVSVSGNAMGDDAAATLVKGMIMSSCILSSLDISSNEAGDLTCTRLAEAVASNTTLLKLDISWNRIRGKCAACLALALVGNTTLTSLSASWNGFGGVENACDHAPAGAEILSDYVDSHTTSIQYNIATGASASMQYFSDWLMKTSALRCLDLAHNRISAEGCIVLAAGLERCSCLDTLKLDGNPIYRSGSQSIWMASARSSDAFSRHRVLSLSECGLSSGLDAFDPTEPGGKYALDMRLVYAHTILRNLMRIAAEGDGMLVDTLLDGKPLKLNAMATEHTEWNLPTSGMLCTRFLWLKALHNTHKPSTPMSKHFAECILDVLNGDLRPIDQNVFLKTAFAGSSLSLEQVMLLLGKTTVSSSRVNLVCNIFHKMNSQHDQDEVLESLDSLSLDQVLQRLGAVVVFTKNNPTGGYHLNLGDEDDREVVSLLCQVKNVELQKQYSTGAKSSEIELIWRNAKVKGAHHKFRADRCLPHNGFLEVDLVSSQLPEAGATAMDSEAFATLFQAMQLGPHHGKCHESDAQQGEPWSRRRQQLLWAPSTAAEGALVWEGAAPECETQERGAENGEEQGLVHETAKQQQIVERRAVMVLRRWSDGVFFTCQQVRKVLAFFKFVPTQAEAFVITFRRTVDWHGLSSILFDLPAAVSETLRRRLGAWNLFDYAAAVGHYELDLAIPEERQVMLTLLQCGAEEPGVNMMDTAYNGVSFEFPSPWRTGSCPTVGLVSFFYCREQGTIDKIRAQSEAKHPGSFPPDWVQPAGCDWVTAFKLRSIKRKFQVMHGNDPRAIFQIIDRNSDGSISRLEFAAALRDINVWLHPTETTALMDALDKDKNDLIDEPEWLLFWQRTV